MMTTTTILTTTLTPMMMMRRILLRNTPSSYARRRGESYRSYGKDEEKARDGVKMQMVEISGNKAQV